MSTKTTFKRIALATVAVMGFGLLSVVPAQAAIVITDTESYSQADGADDTETVSAVTSTFGTVYRATADSWRVPFTLSITGTGFDADTAYLVDGAATSATADRNIVITFSADSEEEVTVNSATSATIEAELIFTTTAGGEAYADITSAAATYAVVLGVDGEDATAKDVVIAAANAFDIPNLSSAVTTNSNFTQVVNGDAEFQFTSATTARRYTVTSSGVGSILSAPANAGGTVTPLTASGVSSGFSWIPDDGNTDVAQIAIRSSSATAGVQVVTLRPVGETGLPGTAITVTINWSSAANTLAKSVITQETGTSNATGTTYYGSNSATATAAIASFEIEQQNTAGAALDLALTSAVVIQLTGVGSLASAAGGAVTSVQAYPAAGFANPTTFAVWGSGTSGTSTVTVSVGGSQIWSKSFYFYGTPATIEATANYTIVRAGGYAAGSLDDVAGVPTADNNPAIAVAVKDSAGQTVPVVPTLVSSNAAVILSGATDSFSDTGTGTYSAGFGMAHYTYSSTASSTSGQTSDLTFTYQLSNGTVLTSNVVKVTTGGTRTGGTVTATLDKTSYEPGEKMVLTFNAKDASGNPVYDGITQAAPVANKSVTGLAAATDIYVDGEFVFGDDSGENLYAPAVSGPFEIVVSTGTATGATITVTATVGDDAATAASTAAADAAAEATDAANAATDAANAAAEAADAATAAAQDAADAVAALATQVATYISNLRKQITSLTNLVIKIQKKVNA